MDSARELLRQSGISATNMIEIADRAQVSRASLYNHFRDKQEVFLALVETEIERIATIALVSPSRAEALYQISREISEHDGLRKALERDGNLVAAALISRDHQIWEEIYWCNKHQSRNKIRVRFPCWNWTCNCCTDRFLQKSEWTIYGIRGPH